MPYFLVGLVLPSLLTTEPSVSHLVVANVQLMLAVLQFSSYFLVICIASVLADKFGEFATLARFVKFAIFAACKGGPLVLLCVLPGCLLTNLVNSPHLSNLPHSLLAKGTLLSCIYCFVAFQ